MAEIWNLGAICRCCHTDGEFKSLQAPYLFENQIEVYSTLLQETFGVQVNPPPLNWSYSICEDCIRQLRAAARFRRQVLTCERKFQEYCTNEQSQLTVHIKEEIELYPDENDSKPDSKTSLVFHKEEKPDIKADGSDSEDNGAFDNIKTEDSRLEDDECVTKLEIKSPKKELVKKNKNVAKKGKRNRSKKRLKTVPQKRTDPSLEVIVKTENGVLYSCKLCEGVYDAKKLLVKHIQDNHMNYTYKCKTCGEKFKERALLLEHGKSQPKCRPFKCSYCPKRFFAKSYLKYHELTHTSSQRFKCDLCQKDFKNKQVLKRHILWHNGLSKKEMCEICGHTFNDKANLRIHITVVHEKIRNFICDICLKAFSAKKHLTVHLRKHTGERPYRCDLCDAGFIDLTSLKKHGESHGMKVAKYVCKVCNEVLEHRGKFRIHVRKHKGELPYKCHLCSKDFSCKYSLNRHVFLHSGLRPHICQICQATFNHKTQLDRHVKNVHDPNKLGKPKMKCSVCKKYFTDIEKHEKSHTTRPHACEYCNKRYPEKNTLNRHVKLAHMGLKSHVCNTCGKKYTKIYSLKRHEMKVHQIVPKVERSDNLDMVLPTYPIKNDGES